jgi:hypothetical protein
MPKLLVRTAGTAALLLAAALLTPRVQATVSMTPTGIQVAADKGLFEQARVACTHRRVCRQGAGCAWRKVCKRW